MSVGVLELMFLLFVILFVLGAQAVTKKGRWSWLLGIPVCVAVAVVVTPADAGSAFIVATPLTLAYAYWALKRDQQHVKKSE